MPIAAVRSLIEVPSNPFSQNTFMAQPSASSRSNFGGRAMSRW